MSQIVVNVDPLQTGDGSVCSVARAPFDLDNPHAVQVVQFDDVANLVGPNVVRQIGEQLAALIRGNQTVNDALKMAFQQPARTSLPICFRVGDPVAHALSWEALVDGGGFVALDDRWPIARIARGGVVPEGAERPFAPPLRLLLVLSAVGRPAIREWTGIYGAVEAARNQRFPVDVTLFAGEEENVIDVVAALNDPHVTVRPVPGTASQLLEAIEEEAPHLVHFYCHGSIVDRDRRLEIGTITDHDNNANTSSIILRVEELGTAAAATGTWAVTLNTCRGADAGDEALTHAEELVNKGVPVAIGMRRLIDADDAITFSGAFYPAVFAAVKDATDPINGEPRLVVWPDTLVRARRRLRDEHGANPAADDAWTVPVLYTCAGDFRLKIAEGDDTGAATHGLAESGKIEEFFDVVADSAPAGLLQDLEELAPADGGGI